MTVQFTLPDPGTRGFGTPDPGPDMASVLRALNASGAQFNALNAAFGGGADPTGVADSAGALNTGLAATPSGCVFALPAMVPGTTTQAVYKTTGPLLVPPGVTFLSTGWSYGTPQTGAVIKPAATFAQGSAPAAAAVVIADMFSAGWAVENANAGLWGIGVDASVAPAGIDCLALWGTVSNPWLRNVYFRAAPRYGISTGTSGAGYPSGMHFADFKVQACGQQGIYAPGGMADCWWTRGHVSGNGTAGTYPGISYTAGGNASMSQVRSEWNSGRGWEITQNSTKAGGCSHSQCSTDRNTLDGFYVTGTGTAGVFFVNCFARRDGRNGNSGGGGYAGLLVSSCTAPVFWDGCSIGTGVDDNGTGTNSPDYGAVTSGAAKLVLGKGYYRGDTAPLLLDTGSTVRVDPYAQLYAGTALTEVAPVVAGLTASGPGSVSAFSGNDHYGHFTLTPSGTPATGAQASVTFATPRSGTPDMILVQCWNLTSNAAITTVAHTASSATGFNVHSGTVLTAGSNYRWTYQVLG